MPCVHYKFFSKLTHNTIIFHGLHITLKDLKHQIMIQEKLKRCDLRITNSQTDEEYTDDDDVIPIYTTVTVRRIPGTGLKSTHIRNTNCWSEASSGSSKVQVNGSPLSLEQLLTTENLAEANASEVDKIKAVMYQSSCCYYSTNEALKLVGVQTRVQTEALHPNYVCYNCGIPGHHIRNCPKPRNPSSVASKRIRRVSGIPASFLMKVDDPNRKGVMLSKDGTHVIPFINREAYASQKKENPPFLLQNGSSSSTTDEDSVPDALLCQICKDLMTDAVMIPCCKNSYCDECIRTCLLNSDEHVCPTCNQTPVSPDALDANMFLRQEVNRFKNRVDGSRFTHFPKRQFSDMASSSTNHPSSSSASEPRGSGTHLSSKRRRDTEDCGSRPESKKTKHRS